ncbi:galectin-1-like isoform X8 [Notamacropus eugenii]|uniref:galectin-1-like isoform X8 n=1 Tax=Notamacropus eugenii TaxID=9315 RepID=UPI003B68426F
MWTRGCSLPTTGTEGIQNEKAALKKNAGDGRWKGERDGRQWELLATGLDLQPGICIKILGDIPPDAKQFRINVSKDELNIGLHFNLSWFNYLGDYNIVVYNTRTEGTWSTEQMINHFPCVPGVTNEIWIRQTAF